MLQTRGCLSRAIRLRALQWCVTAARTCILAATRHSQFKENDQTLEIEFISTTNRNRATQFEFRASLHGCPNIGRFGRKLCEMQDDPGRPTENHSGVSGVYRCLAGPRGLPCACNMHDTFGGSSWLLHVADDALLKRRGEADHVMFALVNANRPRGTNAKAVAQERGTPSHTKQTPAPQINRQQTATSNITNRGNTSRYKWTLSPEQ